MSAHTFKAASLALSFALNILVARLLPGPQAGAFMTMMVVLPALSMAGRCGTDIFVLRYAHSGRSGGPDSERQAVPYRQLTRVALVGSAGVAVASALLLVPIGPLFTAAVGVSPVAVLPMIAAIPLHAVCVLDSAVLRSLSRFRLAPFLELGLAQAAAIGIVYPLSWVVGSKFLAFSLATLLGLSITALVSRAAAGRALGAGRAHDGAPLKIRPMAWIAIGGIAYYGWTWLPAFCAWLALGAADAGIAIAILKYVALLNLVQVVQVNALLPKVAILKSTARIASISRLMRRQLLKAAPLNGAIALGLALLARPLLAAYGTSYAQHSQLLAQTAIAFGVVWTIFGLVVPVAAVVGEARLTTLWTFCAGFVTLSSLAVTGGNLWSIMATYVVLTAALMTVLTVGVKQRVGCSIALGYR